MEKELYSSTLKSILHIKSTIYDGKNQLKLETVNQSLFVIL